ncbi:hypothetical protein SteCoe_1412 [Stentor coeruleus]|uniref:Calcium uniporter protein C-terminal domain-containing protein n=1 Tax=Stentor coeruleus TaxID=5963 RepID=A0A1R2D1Q5_9CILI|nr:hypothetical protein SteCoe_1412 [Stentor coeruleus]
MALSNYMLKNAHFLSIRVSETLQYPYFILPNTPKEVIFSLNPIKALRDLRNEISQYYKGLPIEFFGIDNTKLSLGSSVLDSIADPLYIKIGEDKTFVLYNLDVNQLYLTPSQRILVQQYEKEKNLIREEAEVIGTFNYYILKELNDISSNMITSETFGLIVKNAILKYGTQVLQQIQTLEAQLELLKSNHAFEIDAHKEATKKAEIYSNKVIKRWYYVIVLQFLGVQYGTYRLYSWDIMEPFTCMTAMADISFGYLVWLMCGKKGFGIEGLKKYLFDKKYNKLMRKKKLNPDEVAHIIRIMESLKTRIKNL